MGISKEIPRTAERIFKGVFAVISCGALLGACSSEEPFSISRDQVVGTWESKDAGKISLLSDHRFTTSGLKFRHDIVEGCERGLVSGTWAFYSDGDHGVSDYSKTAGPTLGLGFDSKKNDCFFDLDAHKSKGVITLCITIDPDAVCGGGAEFTKLEEPARKSD